MEMWFSEFHTPDVKHSIRVNRQLFSRQSDYQRIDIFETPEFGRVLTLDGNVMLTERDEFIYDEMITHVPMAIHKEAKDIRVFDKDIFEALIYKVVIGDYDSNGNKDPYVIRFIVKSGIENVKDKIESKVIENILNKENLILDFYSWQNYVSFEKQADGSLRKKLETKIRVKVELNSDNTTQ